MTVGFQSFLSGGSIVQIDSSYINLHYLQHATLTMPSAVGGTVFNTYSMANANSMLVTRSEVGAKFTSQSGTSAIFHGPGIGASWTLDVYEFRQGFPAQSSGAGLEVYRSDGSLAFTSFAPPMNVVNVYNVAAPGTMVAEPVGSDYGVLQMDMYSEIEYSLADQTITFRNGIASTGGGLCKVEVMDKRVLSAAVSADDLVQNTGHYAVIDLTGIA